MDDLTVTVELGAAIRRARLERGLTQVELAELAGVSRSWLSGVERGVRPGARTSKLEDVLDVLELGEADASGGVGILRVPSIQGWKPPTYPVLEQLRKMDLLGKGPIVPGLDRYLKTIRQVQRPPLSGLERALQAQKQLAKSQTETLAPSIHALQIAAARLAKSQIPGLQGLNRANTQIPSSLQQILTSPRMQVPVVKLPSSAFLGLPTPTLDALRRITEMRLPAVSTNAVTRAAIEAIRAASQWDEAEDGDADVSAVLRHRTARLQALIDDDAFPAAPFPVSATGGPVGAGVEEP